MAERLTRNNKVNFYFHDEASNMVYYKLQKLEDIMEKYHCNDIEELEKKLADFDTIMKGNKFQSIEELQNALNGKFIEVFDEKNKIWQDMVKNLTKTEQDRDTWKRACELACDYMCKFVIPCPDIHRKECESFCDLNKADCYKDYFYQQAKKDGNDERN